MKIKSITKDKGMSPPSGAFDFRPNRTVDSNPKLSNMKGDYVSPKNKRRRKYYIGGGFDRYASPYKLLEIKDPIITTLIPKIYSPIYLNPVSTNKEETQDKPVYSTYWEDSTYDKPTEYNIPDSLIDLLNLEGFNFKVSSGFRPNSITAQGRRSNHSLGDAEHPGAYDIVPLEGTFDEFESKIYSNPRVLAWLDKNGWGSLKENVVRNGLRGFLRTDGTFANTNATGNHFHFGPDSRALEWKEVNRRKYNKSSLELFKKGHKIHIKKENRGKFTAYCGGNVTSSCIAKAKASGNPTLVKRATFAANARKWKHLQGGVIEGAYTLYNGLPIRTVNIPEVTVTGNKFKYLNAKSEKEKNNFFRPFTKFIFDSYSAPKDSYFNATVPYGLGLGHERDNIIQIHNGKSGEMDRFGMYGAIKGKDGKYRFKNPNYKPSQDPEYQRLKSDLGFGDSSDSEFLKWCAENGNRLSLALGSPTTGDAWTRHGVFGDSLIIQSPNKKEDYLFGGEGIKAKNLAKDQGNYVAENIDKHELKTGDIVDMYYKGSDYLNRAFREGDNNRTNSHTGTILKTGRDKEYTYVVHSTGDGLNILPIGELLKPGFLSKSYITGIRRPGTKKHPYKK